MSLSFSPLAVELEDYAAKLTRNTLVTCFLNKIAKLVSIVTCHVRVEILLGEHDVRSDSAAVYAQAAHGLLFGGLSIHVPPMIAAMLLWNITHATGLLEVYSAIKRADSSFSLTLEQRMKLSMSYNEYRRKVHVPSADLMVIHSSVVK